MRLDFTFWDEWRGSLDGRPTMWISRLIQIPFWRRNGKWLSFRVDLHKFVGADDPGCFHSHPAWAIRVPYWGGYVEEIFSPPLRHFKILRTWKPLSIGIVPPSLTHRVDALLNGVASYSLWIRGPICASTKLEGDGWAAQRERANKGASK